MSGGGAADLLASWADPNEDDRCNAAQDRSPSIRGASQLLWLACELFTLMI